ncbi:hypothetical protein DM77_1653 [Burkholderia mallei]|nr:hypothetical protein DM46_1249 [Burkholderia mallei]KOT08037.1 hypothetical protein DM77_1653 [Burkholderia mallei]
MAGRLARRVCDAVGVRGAGGGRSIGAAEIAPALRRFVAVRDDVRRFICYHARAASFHRRFALSLIVDER